jgi:hypothetical protein
MNDYNKGDMVVMNRDQYGCYEGESLTYVRPNESFPGRSVLKKIDGGFYNVNTISFDLRDAIKCENSLLIDNMEMGHLYTVINPVHEFEQGFFEYVESDSPGDGKAFFIKVRGGEHYLFDLSSMEPANLTVNIDGLECELDQGEYEEVMEIIKRHKGKR